MSWCLYALPVQAFKTKLMQYRYELMPSTLEWYGSCRFRTLISRIPKKINCIPWGPLSERPRNICITWNYMPLEQSLHGYQSGMCLPLPLESTCPSHSHSVQAMGNETLQSPINALSLWVMACSILISNKKGPIISNFKTPYHPFVTMLGKGSQVDVGPVSSIVLVNVAIHVKMSFVRHHENCALPKKNNI